MKRREALKNTAIFLGGVSLVSATGMIQSCQPETGLDWTPKFLSKDEVLSLAEIAETILPKTSTPGAKDAQVERYLDEYGHKFLVVEEQKTFKDGIAVFESTAQELKGKSFVKLDIDQRGEVLQSMIDNPSKNEMNPSEVFYQIRDAVNLAFFTSEVGATTSLDNMPIPGEYIGDMPISETKGKVYS